MFTWIPTFLEEEKDLSIVGTSGYLAVVIAGAYTGYLVSGWVWASSPRVAGIEFDNDVDVHGVCRTRGTEGG
jgi:hypothetical protein